MPRGKIEKISGRLGARPRRCVSSEPGAVAHEIPSTSTELALPTLHLQIACVPRADEGNERWDIAGLDVGQCRW